MVDRLSFCPRPWRSGSGRACRGTPRGSGAWAIERGVTVPSVATAIGQSAGSRGVGRALSPEWAAHPGREAVAAYEYYERANPLGNVVIAVG